MEFDLSFYIPPERMTFETAQQIQRYADLLELDVHFDDYSGKFTFSNVPSPKEFDLLTEMEYQKAMPTGAVSPPLQSFTKFFGKGTAMTLDAVRIYCRMCEGGNVW